MERNLLVVLGIATLVVTTGCAGLFGGGDTTESTPADTATTAAEPATTERTSGGESTDGTAENGGTTAATETTAESPSPAFEAAGEHRDRLRSAGSFTTRITQRRTVDGTTQQLDGVWRVDYGADRYRMNATISSDGQTLKTGKYTAGDTTYQRVVVPGVTERHRSASEPYDGDVEPVNRTIALGGEDLVTEFRKQDLEPAGTGTFRGEEMRKFTASGPDAWDVPLPTVEGDGTTYEVVEITAFEMTVLVDDDGIARVVEVSVEGTLESGGEYAQRSRVVYVDVGSTTVSEPDWTEKAK